MKDIFNIAIGEYDLDGNGAADGDLAKYVERLKNAKTWDELYTVFKEVYPAVNGNKNAQLVLIEAKDADRRLGLTTAPMGYECEQHSDEWRSLRIGKVTASRICDVMAEIKKGEAATRRNYRAW